LSYVAPPERTGNETLTVSALRSSAGSTTLPLAGWTEQIQSAGLQHAVNAMRSGASNVPAANAQVAGSPTGSGSGGWSLGFAPGYGLPPPTVTPQPPLTVTLVVAPTAP